ncbi:transposase [Streptomyces lannensis]|uniref:Transposase IS4-like domain-containing protein n=1 Tax=Streptomyces lannensis TaxID=766498 RepID=A0ABP7KSJ7_9ACTN
MDGNGAPRLKLTVITDDACGPRLCRGCGGPPMPSAKATAVFCEDACRSRHWRRMRRANPADELIALYRQRWEIELAFDEIKNHLGPGGPPRSRTPEAVRQELWALLAVHQAVRRFAHDAAANGPVLDADRLSYLRCVRIARRGVPSQHGTSRRTLTNAWKGAIQEARSCLLPPRSGRDWPRAIKKPMRWPILRTRSGRSKVAPGRWAHNQTTKQRRPVPCAPMPRS